MQVTLARWVTPTCPCHCRKALLSWDIPAGQVAAAPAVPLCGWFAGTLPTQQLPRWLVLVGAGYSLAASLCPRALFGYWMLWSRSSSLLERERGRGIDALLGSPRLMPAPHATLASIYPKFFQCPPRSFDFSCIQIFVFYSFVQFCIARLMLAESHPWWGRPLSSTSPGWAEPCPSTHHPFSSPEHTS